MHASYQSLLNISSFESKGDCETNELIVRLKTIAIAVNELTAVLTSSSHTFGYFLCETSAD